MKKWWGMLGVVGAMTLSALLLGGCGASKTSGNDSSLSLEEKSADSDVFKVAFICQADDQWFRQCYEICKKRVEEEFDDVEFVLFDNKNDQSVTDSVLEQLVMEGDWDLCGYVTMADNTALIKQLQDTGCSTVCMVAEWEWNEGVTGSFVCSEHDLSYLAAQAALDKLPENSNVVILRGVEGYTGTTLRGEGFQEALAARPDIKVLDEKYCNFVKANAVTQMEDWIIRFGSDIDGIISENDGMALGAIEALNSSGIDAKPLVISGIDALYEGAVAIKDGLIDYSTFNDTDNFASAYINRIKALKAGEIDAYYIGTETFSGKLIDQNDVDDLLKRYEELGLNQ